MKIFAISDLHFSNDNLKPMDIYGPVWEDHQNRVKIEWEKLVTDDDIVIVGGDSSWGLKLSDAMPDLKYIASFPGKKVIVKGNHDLWWSSLKKMNEIDESLFFLRNNHYDAGEYAICGSRGWICPGDSEFLEHDEKIYNRELLRLRMSLESVKDRKKIIVCIHYPPFNDKREDTGFTKLFHEFSVKTVMYGHLHGEESHNRAVKGERDGINYHLISCDYLNCVPIQIK